MGATKLTYQQAGVDTRRAAALVGDIKSHVARTQQNRKLLGAFGLFAACYDLSSYKEPVIVTGCDGVGTKLELLLEHDLLEIAGKDLVAMSVNDILTTGGDPLLILDYIGIAALNEEKITRLIAGMCDYLASCDCILAGGETAEMPGIVPPEVIELSGFCIGCAEKPGLVDPSTLKVGDVLVGYKSDSIHANGWSLVRRVLRENPGCVSEDELRGFLKPTRLYHDVVRDIRPTLGFEQVRRRGGEEREHVVNRRTRASSTRRPPRPPDQRLREVAKIRVHFRREPTGEQLGPAKLHALEQA